MSLCAGEPAPSGPLRVLFLSDHLGHANGRIHGVTTYFMETLPAFDRTRVTPTLCILKPTHRAAAHFVAAGVQPIFLGRAKWDPRSFIDLIRLLRQREIDLLHVSGEKSLLLGRVAAHLTGRPAIAHFHDTLPAPPWMRAVQRRLAPWTAAAVAVSDWVRDWAIGELALPPERIKVLHNGHNVGRFATPGPDARARLRRELEAGTATPIIGVIGRIDAVKGQTLMIRAMPRVLERQPGALLVLAGDGSERMRCQKLVRKLGIGRAVRFLGQRDDVPDLLAALDVVAMPSLSEALPYVALEAAAAGRPVVAFRTGGVPELVLHERTGLLVPPGDVAALADKLCRVLEDADLRQTLGEHGRAHAQQFTVARHIRGLESLYANVCVPFQPAAAPLDEAHRST
jgi:glycosyltransferase involved in cell wall biosynthesis